MISASESGVLNEDIVNAVLLERTRQDKQWGGANHDDEHGMHDWANFVHKQARGVKQLDAFSIANAERFEEHMVKIAALAFAAIKSNRRRLKKHHGVA